MPGGGDTAGWRMSERRWTLRFAGHDRDELVDGAATFLYVNCHGPLYSSGDAGYGTS